MNQKNLILLALSLMLLSANTVCGQEMSSPWSAGADLASRYIWRGLNAGGSSPSIQPAIEYTFGSEKHAFSVGTWGAFSTSGTQTTQEVDIYISYTLNEKFSLILTDYFLPDETAARNNYFNFNTDWAKINSGEKAQTGHVLEAALQFNGTEKFPVRVLFAMNIWGADARKYNEVGGVMTAEDKIVMSKYVELGYSTTLKNMNLEIFTGIALDNPNIKKGEPTGYYRQESAGIINLGLTLSKEIQITERFSLPVFTSLILNPEAENIFMVFGISL